MPPPRKPRAERRADERRATKDLRDRERLSLLEVGGTPGHPIEVMSASLVEPRARALPCPLCGASVRLEEHAAKVIDGDLLRLARLLCPTCGHARTVYFVVRPPLAN